MSEELKPCPFCGGNSSTNQFESAGGNGRMIWIVGCENPDCEVTFQGHARKVDAIKAWNTRNDFYKNAALGDLFANAFASNTGQNVNTVFRKLCREHPMISVDPQMLGGMPHVKGFRLSVGDILAKLYIHGDVDKVTAMFEPDLSKEHIKEAIAFAQDFLEAMSVIKELTNEVKKVIVHTDCLSHICSLSATD